MIFDPDVSVSSREPVVPPAPETPPSPPVVLSTTMSEQPLDPNDDHGPNDSNDEEAELRAHGYTLAGIVNEIKELNIELPTEEELGGTTMGGKWDDLETEEERLLDNEFPLGVKTEEERAAVKALEEDVATDLIEAHNEADVINTATKSRVAAGKSPAATTESKEKVKAGDHWIGDDWNQPMYQRIAAGSKRTDKEIARQCMAEEKAAEEAGKPFNMLQRMNELHKENLQAKLTKEETIRAVSILTPSRPHALTLAKRINADLSFRLGGQVHGGQSDREARYGDWDGGGSCRWRERVSKLHFPFQNPRTP